MAPAAPLCEAVAAAVPVAAQAGEAVPSSSAGVGVGLAGVALEDSVGWGVALARRGGEGEDALVGQAPAVARAVPSAVAELRGGLGVELAGAEPLAGCDALAEVEREGRGRAEALRAGLPGVTGAAEGVPPPAAGVGVGGRGVAV